MSSIFDQLTQQLASGGLDQIAERLGADRGTTEKAVPAAVGTLMSALASNSARSGGAEALLGAITKDHDGSVLNDLPGFFQNPRQEDGEGILRHVLGGKRASVEAGLGQSLGLDAGSTGKLLTMLAPLVMGALGKARQQGQLDAGGLASMLGAERQAATQKLPADLGVLGSLLDRDGDGQIADDVAKLGGGLLKNLFGRR